MKAKKLILDECVFSEILDGKPIKSMANKKYLKDVSIINKIIENEQDKNDKTYERCRELIIK